MNCKPGDLAIVVRVDHEGDRDVIGLIVEVITATPFFEWTDPNQPEWVCRTRTAIRMLEVSTQEIVLSSEFDVKDSWLRPISGMPVTDDVEDEVMV
ncbi:hypothetical protein [Burkholderia ambifaria]|uniref:hypothetical protein n=1 Tax=Burkholderia ambifaria TaxID=152480 RepID=UPI00158C9917|nr:hypothetical protein [Burkholderia ambifaria]